MVHLISNGLLSHTVTARAFWCGLRPLIRFGPRLRIYCNTMEYNYDGSVFAWGPANSTMLVDADDGTGDGCQTVPSWRLLRVDAYFRLSRRWRPDNGAYDGWVLHNSFWVNRWENIEEVFDRYFDSGGLYERVSFHVEVCYWNSVEGWAYDDCL